MCACVFVYAFLVHSVKDFFCLSIGLWTFIHRTFSVCISIMIHACHSILSVAKYLICFVGDHVNRQSRYSGRGREDRPRRDHKKDNDSDVSINVPIF